jgi:hypothetical protein
VAKGVNLRSGVFGGVNMIDKRFSSRAFESHGIDTEGARRLADTLADEIQQELHKVIEPRFMEIVANLNAMGHDLKLYDQVEPGGIAFRDDMETGSGYKCKLRVAFDTVVSTGYAHLYTDEEAGED